MDRWGGVSLTLLQINCVRGFIDYVYIIEICLHIETK
jgi:hypothetical protein